MNRALYVNALKKQSQFALPVHAAAMLESVPDIV
jgi:hypothetical protein